MIRPIAMYLPQFHPIPENDEWWGKGFTEWTNVVRARPLYKGHYQPHLPADLGFYDLRLAEVRAAQAQIARDYGIYGFCYYHYWFNGRRILERPFQEVFETGEPNFPFMLCWANENWSRTWDGEDKCVLLQQCYSEEDDLNHIRVLIPYFKDQRYIRVNGKPVFAVYNSASLPDDKRTVSIWRREAEKHGLELYLCRFEHAGTHGARYLCAGFDAAIEFQPQIRRVVVQQKTTKTLRDELSFAIFRRSIKFRARRIYYKVTRQRDVRGNSRDYKQHIESSISRYNEVGNYKLYRSVCPGWDNTARKGDDALIIDGSTPELFRYWVQEALKGFKVYSDEENMFFINAWNEWAEGNHMEPCQKWGRAYLEAFKKALILSAKTKNAAKESVGMCDCS
jgi:lipopolysaccharide biosynthesis protein